MATIKAQLKNDNGDTIIPAIGPVQTNEIADEAVTGGKLDWDTLKGSFPVASRIDLSLGFGIIVNLYRIANMVFANYATQVRTLSAYERLLLDETIPEGYRPNLYGTIIGATQDGVDSRPCWEIHPNGGMYLTNRESGVTRFILNGCWVTNDPWPSA